MSDEIDVCIGYLWVVIGDGMCFGVVCLKWCLVVGDFW